MELTGIERFFAEFDEKEAQRAERLHLRAQEIKKQACQEEVNVLTARLQVLRGKMRAREIAFATEVAPLDMEIRDMEERVIEIRHKLFVNFDDPVIGECEQRRWRREAA